MHILLPLLSVYPSVSAPSRNRFRYDRYAVGDEVHVFRIKYDWASFRHGNTVFFLFFFSNKVGRVYLSRIKERDVTSVKSS